MLAAGNGQIKWVKFAKGTKEGPGEWKPRARPRG